jgi:hypothetical protein
MRVDRSTLPAPQRAGRTLSPRSDKTAPDEWGTARPPEFAADHGGPAVTLPAITQLLFAKPAACDTLADMPE